MAIRERGVSPVDTANSSSLLSDRVALVTGAGRGIGQAMAIALAEAGSRVALMARTDSELSATKKLITANGGRAIAARADVADERECAAAVQTVVREFGEIEILVNNAGVVWPLGPSAQVAVAEWEMAFQINLLGPIRMSRMVIPGMVEHRWGRIVNISSRAVAAPAKMIGGNTYVTTKSGLEAHSLNLASELIDTGVTVNALRPGTIETSMQQWVRSQRPDDIGDGLYESFMAMQAAGELWTPKHPAGLLLGLLASDVTGMILDAVDYR